MGPKTVITMGAQTVISAIHRQPADVLTRAMCGNIGENYTNFCRHVDQKCYNEARTKC